MILYVYKKIQYKQYVMIFSENLPKIESVFARISQERVILFIDLCVSMYDVRVSIKG